MLYSNSGKQNHLKYWFLTREVISESLMEVIQSLAFELVAMGDCKKWPPGFVVLPIEKQRLPFCLRFLWSKDGIRAALWASDTPAAVLSLRVTTP